jgi:hypothetical protein
VPQGLEDLGRKIAGDMQKVYTSQHFARPRGECAQLPTLEKRRAHAFLRRYFYSV